MLEIAIWALVVVVALVGVLITNAIYDLKNTIARAEIVRNARVAP